jgi:hypothetical protein
LISGHAYQTYAETQTTTATIPMNQVSMARHTAVAVRAKINRGSLACGLEPIRPLSPPAGGRSG